MTSREHFDIGRSDAIRQLLIDTVAAEPARERRMRVGLVAAITGAALAIAGGTAALAAAGVIQLGAPEPAPAPAPTVVVSPTPAATPTTIPTPTPTTSAPVVTDGPVLPHDVTSPAGTPRWSLDLPDVDDGCHMSPVATDLADGRALYVSGLRPKEYEGGPCATTARDEHIMLTSVDTENGRILWTRNWSFTPKYSGRTEVRVLGTSGRAVISYGDNPLFGGIQEVIDLRTGAMVAPFRAPDGFHLSAAEVVPGPSGDIVGQLPESSTVVRFNPVDATHVLWRTDLPGTVLLTAGVPEGGSVVPVVWGARESSHHGTLDLETGAISGAQGMGFSRPTPGAVSIWQEPRSDGTIHLIATDGDGTLAWERDLPKGTQIADVVAPGRMAGAPAGASAVGAGKLAFVDEEWLTLVDEETGDELWTSPVSGCGIQPFLGAPTVLDDDARDAYVVYFPQDTTCSFDRASGRMLRGLGIPLDGWSVWGQSVTYGVTSEEGSGAAYDRTDGSVLWTLPVQKGETWSFVGGHLVRQQRGHIVSIG